jgi:hypothetical protein
MNNGEEVSSNEDGIWFGALNALFVKCQVRVQVLPHVRVTMHMSG